MIVCVVCVCQFGPKWWGPKNQSWRPEGPRLEAWRRFWGEGSTS